MGKRRGWAIQFQSLNRVRLVSKSFGSPKGGFLRLRVAVCGVCHREWHVLRGRIPRAFPLVMGHEPVGIVDAVGAGVTGFAPGEWITGVGVSSLAEYDLVDARYVAPLKIPPARPERFLGEPVMCAVNAVNRLLEPSNSKVVVNGVGFMGHLLIQAIRMKCPSAWIVAVDPSAAARHRARHCGADRVFAGTNRLLATFPRKADVVYEASGAPGTVYPCTALVRNGGSLALLGHHFQIEPPAVNEWHLRGISVHNVVPWSAPDLGAEIREAVALLNCKRIRFLSPVRKIALDEAVKVMAAWDLRCPTKLVVQFAAG